MNKYMHNNSSNNINNDRERERGKRGEERRGGVRDGERGERGEFLSSEWQCDCLVDCILEAQFENAVACTETASDEPTIHVDEHLYGGHVKNCSGSGLLT